MSTLTIVLLAWLLVAVPAFLILYCCCVVAGRADDRAKEALREQEREAREHIYGDGWHR